MCKRNLARDTIVHIILCTSISSGAHYNISYPHTPQMDWLSNPEFKNKQVDLKMGLGRDEILVPKKGQVVLKGFGDMAIAESEGSHLGPGKAEYLSCRDTVICEFCILICSWFI